MSPASQSSTHKGGSEMMTARRRAGLHLLTQLSECDFRWCPHPRIYLTLSYKDAASGQPGQPGAACQEKLSITHFTSHQLAQFDVKLCSVTPTMHLAIDLDGFPSITNIYINWVLCAFQTNWFGHIFSHSDSLTHLRRSRVYVFSQPLGIDCLVQGQV